MNGFGTKLEQCFRNMNTNLETCIPYWDQHQEYIRKMVISVLEHRESSDVSLIIGAGNCYDVPLQLICESYNENHLLDLDEETLTKTKEKCDKDIYEKIKLIKKELTGINETDANELLRCLSFGNYLKAEAILFDLINGTNCLPELVGSNKYSLIISSTVSTQLLIPLIQAIEQTGNDRLITLAKKLGDTLAEKHYCQIIDLLTNGSGVGIITSEQYAWGSLPDGRNLPLSKFIEKPELMLRDDIQKLIEKHGGSYIINGRINFNRLTNVQPEINVISQEQWIWRFSENIYYLVKGWIIKKQELPTN